MISPAARIAGPPATSAQTTSGRPGTEGFLSGIVESWVAPIAGALATAGADERTARADARLGVAVVRGLLLDLLATGDRDEVSEAYQRFLHHARGAGGLPSRAGPDDRDSADTGGGPRQAARRQRPASRG